MNDLTRKRLLSVVSLLLAVCLLFTLTGCSSFQSCIESTRIYQRMNPPQLIVYGGAADARPTISECVNAEGITAGLSSYFDPICSLVAACNSGGEGEVARLSYELRPTDDELCYVLSSCVVSPETGSMIALPDIDIRSDGEFTVSAPLPSLDWLSEPAFARGFFYMLGRGLAVSPERRGDSVTKTELYDTFLRCLESEGCSFPTDRFVDRGARSELQLKAIVAGLYDDPEPVDWDTENAICTDLLGVSADTLERLYTDVYGVGSYVVSKSDVLTAADVLGRVCEPSRSDAFRESWRGILSRALSGESLADGDPLMTRDMIAGVFTRMYEAVCEPVDTSWANSVLTDTENIDCVKAYAYDLMTTYPSHMQFSPACYVWLWQLPDLVRDTLRLLLTGNIEDLFFLDDDISYGDMIAAIGRVAVSAVSGLERAEITERINGRDYDFYISQHGTGPYSAINCMPTITAMAIKWYGGPENAVGVETLRERMLDVADAGWYMSQVTDCLEMYSIPHETNEDIRGGILSELDKGHIVLTQMSENDMGESGHCFVIYGYRKIGDSVQFYIHDPDVSEAPNIYGEPAGKSMLIDGSYVYWVIERITFYIVSVG